MIDENPELRTSILHASNVLSFVPENLEKEYSVRAGVSKIENQENVLHYKVKVNWLPSNRFRYRVRVETKDFLINQKSPSLMIEVLAEECRLPLQHITYNLNDNGQIESLDNYTEIVETWQKVQENLLIKYSGEIIEKYIKTQNEVILDQEILLSKLKQDLFLNHFFYPIYNNVFMDFKLEINEKSNFLNINYNFPMQFRAQNNGRYTAKEQLEFEKKINENVYDFDKMPIENYQAKYVVNKDHSIHSIVGNFKALGQKLAFSIQAKTD